MVTSVGAIANAYLNVAPYLRLALRESSGLKILAAQNYHDFATSFLSAEYSLRRTGILHNRTRYTYYQSSHMTYIRTENRQKLSADVRHFIRSP